MFPKRITKAAVAVLTLIIMMGLGYVLIRERSDHQQTGKASETQAEQGGYTQREEVIAMAKSEISDTRQLAFNLIEETYENILAHPDPEATRKLINNLRKGLISQSSDENTQAILQFLESGLDVETGLGFRVDKRSFLSESPTLRVTLIDVLGILNPEMAANYAEQVFAVKDSPEEWALSLRNVAWNNPESRNVPLLRDKLLEVLTHEPWLENPSAGFLHSFDVAVYTQSQNLLPEFAAMLNRDNSPSLSHAAIMVMDKMTLDNPPLSMSSFLANPKLLSDHPKTRAGFFSRADVSDSRQQIKLETYLLRPDLSTEEVETFAKLFPNFNLIISNNLLTDNHAYSLSEMARIDRASLARAKDWQTDNRFQHLKPQIETLITRLRENIASAERGGF